MLSTEIAQDIYTNSLSLVNFINNYTAKENLPRDQINEVQIRVETLERMVMDLSNIGSTLDLSPLTNSINTGKAFIAASSTSPGFAGTPPSPAPVFADPGFTAPGADPQFEGTPPSPAPGFADPGFIDPGFAST